nr:MAG TPA: hypothetical protein [Caudoviricetes sp.]
MNIIFTFKELNTFLCHITPSFLFKGLELLLEKAHVFPWGRIYIIGVVFT